MKDKKPISEIDIKTFFLEYANSIIATLREPFLVLDKNLRVISANQAFYVTFEVTAKDTIGLSLPDIGNKQWNIPKLLKLLKEIIPEKKIVADYEVEHNFEQIGQRFMLLNAHQLSVPLEVAEIIAESEAVEIKEEELVLLAIEDITERKRLYEELKDSEDRYRRAFETSHDGLMLIHKTEGSILNANEAIQELLGYSHEELLKKKLWEVGVVKDYLDFQETVSILERDGLINYKDTLVKTKKALNISTEVFLVDRAKVIQCNIRNITVRKEEDEALKESEARFKAIFNESTEGLLLTDVESRLFFMCNPKICEMLGYTEEDLLHLRVDDIHPKKDLPFVIEQFERQVKGEIKLSTSIPVKKKDGSIFYADISASNLTLGGKKYLMKSFRDITESKKIHDELNEKMYDLERFSKFAVDRELKMEELEKKIKELEERLKEK